MFGNYSVGMRIAGVAFLGGLVSAVSAHFHLEYPGPRGPFVAANEVNFCGTTYDTYCIVPCPDRGYQTVMVRSRRTVRRSPSATDITCSSRGIRVGPVSYRDAITACMADTSLQLV